MSKALDAIRENVYGSLLPTIGNNDVPVHNRVPCDPQQHQMYYTRLFDVFFPEGKQPEGFNATAAKQTFYAGGYYRYDFPNSSFTLLSLNTMFFKNGNDCGRPEANVMLKWFRQQLTNNPTNRKFILSMHVYPGLNDFEGVQRFWWKGDAENFLNFLNDGSEHVALMTGAHVHLNRMGVPQSHRYPKLKVPLWVSHAISPVYNGNPSYSHMDLSMVNGTVRFDNVGIESYQYMHSNVKSCDDFWETLDPKEEFGFDFNKPETLLEKFERFGTPKRFARARGFVHGVDKLWRNVFLGEVFYPKWLQNHPEYPAQNICPEMWY